MYKRFSYALGNFGPPMDFPPPPPPPPNLPCENPPPPPPPMSGSLRLLLAQAPPQPSSANAKEANSKTDNSLMIVISTFCAVLP